MIEEVTVNQNTCPRCAIPLGSTRAGAVRIYPCEGCGGHALTLSQLRLVAESEQRIQPFWQAVRAAPPAALGCPSCAQPMRAVRISEVEVDACTACHFVWLDPGEQEKLVGTPPPSSRTSEARDAGRLAKQVIAYHEVMDVAEQRREERVEAKAIIGVEVAFGVLEALFWWWT
jgi:Zn-finger nucleic acid-binding protein